MEEQEFKKVDILIVDDDRLSLELAGKILEKDFQIASVGSGQEALAFLEENAPKLILMDLHMPDMDGRETMQRIQEREEWRKIPVIILTADAKPETEEACFAMGATDFIAKPFVPVIMRNRISRAVELYTLRWELESRLAEKTRLVERVSLNSIMVIANTIDAKDTYTSGHSLRVAKCSEAIARRLGWSEGEVRNLHYIALLHDIGKIGVPDSILNKPSRLTAEEFSLIKKHPVIGHEILKDIRMIKGVAEGAYYHHERYDGKGYPNGLKGEEIPFYARIIGIADAYDAMTSNRIYRTKLPTEKVIAEFERCAGTQFDPMLARVFVEMLKEGFYIPAQSRREYDSTNQEEINMAEESSALLSKILTEYGAGKGTVDFLTGLNNRRYGEERVTSLIREGHKGVFVILDLDNFKDVNDAYGHLMGDKVLKLMASALSANMPDTDVVCRMGGDEFVLFLCDVELKRVIEEKIRQIRDAFAENMKDEKCREMVSISAGISLCPRDGRNFSTLYNNADKALYHVKRNGKNSVHFFSPVGMDQEQSKVQTDLDNIRHILEGRMDQAEGIYKVHYDEFKNLYTYLSRCVKRKGQSVQMVLFTLKSGNSGYVDKSIFEEAMSALEVAIAYSLRMVDVGSRYSSVQYLVILVDTNIENGKKVAERVTGQFYRIYSGSGITLSYDIQTLQVEGMRGAEEAKTED